MATPPLIALALVGCVASPTIEDRLVPWSAEREALTLEYAHRHTGDLQGVAIEPVMVVLHGTMDTDLDTHIARLLPPTLPGDRQDLAWAGALNVGVHFVVDPAGRIARTLPETRYGRHTVGFNHVAIGIEHLGDGPEHDLSAEQVRATSWLVRDLLRRHPIRYLAGHHQLIEAPETHPLFAEQLDDYRTFALDPGDDFVEAVAAAVGDDRLISP